MLTKRVNRRNGGPEEQNRGHNDHHTLTQLPTEWVTGDTLARIMYDTFNKLHKDSKIIKRALNDKECLYAWEPVT